MYYWPAAISKLKWVELQIGNRGNRNKYLNVANEWMITNAIQELIIAFVRGA